MRAAASRIIGAGAMREATSRIIGAGAAVGGVGGLIRRSQSIPKPELQTVTGPKPTSSAIAASSDRGATVAEMGARSDDSLPRLVFGGAPSFDEAKEATLELKTAVERTLTSENHAIPGHEEASLPLLIGSEESQSVTCVSSEMSSNRVVTKNAELAFRFLSENPQAQNVVASVASDPNVWDAVFQNTVFVDYVESHRAVAAPPASDVHLEELQDLICYAESETAFVGSAGSTISELLENIKLKLLDIVDNVSNFFQDLFGIPEAVKKSVDDATSSTSSFTETPAFTTSVIGLAIMVISIVVLKRV